MWLHDRHIKPHQHADRFRLLHTVKIAEAVLSYVIKTAFPVNVSVLSTSTSIVGVAGLPALAFALMEQPLVLGLGKPPLFFHFL